MRSIVATFGRKRNSMLAPGRCGKAVLVAMGATLICYHPCVLAGAAGAGPVFMQGKK
ncbi:MAG: hypothetical protein RR376_13230 [Janthinobacterium sp.]